MLTPLFATSGFISGTLWDAVTWCRLGRWCDANIAWWFTSIHGPYTHTVCPTNYAHNSQVMLCCILLWLARGDIYHDVTGYLHIPWCLSFFPDDLSCHVIGDTNTRHGPYNEDWNGWYLYEVILEIYHIYAVHYPTISWYSQGEISESVRSIL